MSNNIACRLNSYAHELDVFMASGKKKFNEIELSIFCP